MGLDLYLQILENQSMTLSHSILTTPLLLHPNMSKSLQSGSTFQSKHFTGERKLLLQGQVFSTSAGYDTYPSCDVSYNTHQLWTLTTPFRVRFFVKTNIARIQSVEFQFFFFLHILLLIQIWNMCCIVWLPLPRFKYILTLPFLIIPKV